MALSKRLIVVAGLVLTGCFDTGLPEPTARGSITGTLDTSNGPAPAAGQSVTLSGDNADARTATTDASGAFVFADLPPGLYLVSVAVNSYAKTTSDLLRVRSGAVADAGALKPDYLGKTDPGTIMGKVVADPSGDVSGAKVEFIYSGVVVDQLVVGADGQFIKTQLAPGTLTLRATHPSFQTAQLADVTLGPRETKDLSSTPLSMRINPATITGTVLEERDGLDPVPSGGATVTLDSGESSTTDVAGNFQLSGLSAGQRTVRLTKPSFHDVAPSRAVTLRPNQTTALEPVTLQLNRGTIVGKVKLADNGPVSGTRVEVAGTNYAGIVSSDGADQSVGGFVIAQVPVGDWSVTARKEQYSIATVSVKVRLDQPADTGVLTLARLLGDFAIEDADPANTPGYSRDAGVTLNFTGFPTTGVTSYRASEDASFDGGSFVSYTGRLQPFTLRAQEGLHTVYAQYTDLNGSVSQTFSSSIVLDTIAPTTPSVELASTGAVGATKYTNRAQDLPVSLVASDPGGSGIALMRLGESVLDGGTVNHATATYVASPVLTRASTGDGVQNVFVQVIDHAGNVSAIGSDSVTVDTTKPAGTLTILPGPRATDPNYTDTAVVTLQQTFTDNDGGIVLARLANSSSALSAAIYQPAQLSTGWFLDPSSPGSKTVWVQYRDPAGNETTNLINDSITYDVSPPNPAIATVLSKLTTNDAGVTLFLQTDTADLSASEGVTVSDEATFTSSATSAPSPFPANAQVKFQLPPGDGQRTLYVRFKDKAGNEASTSAQVTLDTVAPQGSFALSGTLADGSSSPYSTAVMQVTVTLTPEQATEYRLGDSSMTSCPATGYTPLTTQVITGYPLPSNGVVTLCLRDEAGNTQGPLSQTITYDATPPSGCTMTATGTKTDGTAAPANRTAGRTLSITPVCGFDSSVPFHELAVAEGVVNCATAQNLTWQPFAPTTLTLGGNDGLRVISACVRDAARNLATIAPVPMTLDTRGPTAPHVVIDDDAQYINDATAVSRAGNVGMLTAGAQGATQWTYSEDSAAFPMPGGLPATPLTPVPFTFGGTGLRTVYAKFIDDLGNESSVVSDSVTIDRTPPSLTGSPTFTVVTPPGAQSGFTPTQVVTVLSNNLPADAVAMQGQETVGACASLTFSSPVRATSPAFTFNLSGGEGLKTICARLLDAAGNPSALLPTITVTLDTLPPTAPKITTAPALLNKTASTSFTVAIAAPVSETNFYAYQQRGDLTGTDWSTPTAANFVRATTSFGFTLATNARNALRLRAIDKAGNTSPEDTVLVDSDATVPTPPSMNEAWVDNGDGHSTLYWRTSSATDVVAYRLYYGPIPGATGGPAPPTGFRGIAAIEGPSPITVPAVLGAADQSFALTGLNNGSIQYATVTALDAAGNESAAPGGSGLPIGQAILEPNRISANRVGRVDLTNPAQSGYVESISIQGNHAYLVGQAGPNSCSSNLGVGTLTVVDLSALSPSISRGHPQSPLITPTVTFGPVQYADAIGCQSVSSSSYSLVDGVADGPWFFMASGHTVRIFSLLNPDVPSLAATLTLSHTAIALNLVGTRLFVTGETGVSMIRLDELYDADATTLPSDTGPTPDVYGPVTAAGAGPFYPLSGHSTRNRLFTVPTSNGTAGSAYLLDSALTAAPTFTTVGNSVNCASSFPGYSFAKGVVGGNFFYFNTQLAFDVVKLNRLWTSTLAGPCVDVSDVVTSFNNSGGGGMAVAGGQAFALGASELHALELSDLANVTIDGRYSTAGTVLRSVATFGNFVMTGDINALRFLEVATPKALRPVLSATGGGPVAELGPGFLYSGAGRVHSLHYTPGSFGPIAPVADVAGSFDQFVYDLARFDDQLVTAAGPGFYVHNLQDQVDRSPGTTYDAADVTSVMHPTNTVRITGVEAVGNFLVASEVRTDGIWLEVFNARALRDQNPATAFDAATASVATFKVASITTTNGLWAALTVLDGRAIISLDDQFPNTPPTPGLYVVDMQTMLDDVTGSSPVVLGTFAHSGVLQTAVRGGWLYAATKTDLFIADVHQAFTTPATALPATPPSTTLSIQGQQLGPVVLSGSYLFTAGRTGNFIAALDVSTPLSPVVLSTVTVSNSAFSGYPGLQTLVPTGPAVIPYRNGLAVSGSRLYYTAFDQVEVFELE